MNMLALGVCFPRPYSRAGRRFAASRSLWITTHHFVRFHKIEFDEMLCKLDSTEYARLSEPNPTLPWSPKKNREKKVIFLERKKERKNWLLRKRPSCWNLYPRLLPHWASTAGCEGAPPIPTFYHVSCLLLLSCSSLPYVCGLGLCTCSGPQLVCDLLLKGSRGLLPCASPEGYLVSQSWSTLPAGHWAVWRLTYPQGGTITPWNTFLGSSEDLIVGTCLPEDECPQTLWTVFTPWVGLPSGSAIK